MSAPANSDQVDAEPAGKKPKKIVFIAICVAAFAASGAGAYFITRGDQEKQPEIASKEAHTKSKSDKSQHGAAKKKAGHNPEGGAEQSGEKFRVVDGIGVFALDPIVVSIRPSNSVRHLKVAIVVETDPEAGAAFYEREARIRDTLNIYLAAVDSSSFEDPMALVRIREQIARRISTVVSPAPVFAVLITDFILT